MLWIFGLDNKLYKMHGTYIKIKKIMFNGCHPVVFQHRGTCNYVYNTNKLLIIKYLVTYIG
jgi:hypothetical protein